MKFKIVFLILITAIMTNCGNDDDNQSSPLNNANAIRIDDDLFSNAPNDEFKINAVTITGNNLKLTIDYGGGCGEIYYDLITESGYIETDPIQKNMRLAFDDQDNCEALLELELSFDLTAIQVSSTDSILINLEKWENQLVYNY